MVFTFKRQHLNLSLSCLCCTPHPADRCMHTESIFLILFAPRTVHLGRVPARLKLINSGFNTTECWLQTRHLRVLKHAPSSLIIGMCVLAKLMNKSLGGDYDWWVRNKQANISCCWNQRLFCKLQVKQLQTVQWFHHMCFVCLCYRLWFCH